MSDFEAKVKQFAEKSILKLISGGEWVKTDYSSRMKLPESFMAEVWDLVDTEKIKFQMAKRIEDELANKIVNHMAAEMATDVKKILSVPERREALRAVARNHMEAIMQGKSE